MVVIRNSFLSQITTCSYLGIYALSPKSLHFLDPTMQLIHGLWPKCPMLTNEQNPFTPQVDQLENLAVGFEGFTPNSKYLIL